MRLPVDVESGVHGGASFLTTIVTTASGLEYRNIDWAASRGRWDCGYGIQSVDDFKAVQEFFYARRGRGYGFRFKDWSDYQSNPAVGIAGFEAIGTGNGVNLVFQLIKTYESAGPLPYVRTVTRPVAGTVVVKVAGVINANWSVDTTTGIVTFTGGNAPANLAAVTASFEFDKPVRFDTDFFDMTLALFNAGVLPSLPVIEILGV